MDDPRSELLDRCAGAFCGNYVDQRAEIARLKEEQVSLVGSLGDAQAQNIRLRDAYAEYRLWEPGKRGDNPHLPRTR